MVASCTWEKSPSMTHPRNKLTEEVVEVGGRWWRLGEVPPPTFTDLHRPPPTFGAVAASIPMANRNLPQPARLLGIPVARANRASAYTARVPPPAAPVSAPRAARTRGGTPRRSVS